ncbi:DUF2061 domain-containing protein [Candidatus Bathyarchaeota archaeon]|nr:MAG: DUF2061 domain-containing protein [Candidatus Bathyarchaeota archaeon]
MDTKLRSLLKSATWRVTGILVLGATTWIITGNWIQTTYITAIFNVIQVVFYYFHERLWERTNWGKG